MFSDKPTIHKWDKKRGGGVSGGGVLPGKTTDQEEESVYVFFLPLFLFSAK